MFTVPLFNVIFAAFTLKFVTPTAPFKVVFPASAMLKLLEPLTLFVNVMPEPFSVVVALFRTTSPV